uniref:Tektin n=1 Tax=Platynereis dumerilii TaxID=6359 RepID=A0AA49K6N6_PLADU|nr:tektin 3/5B [Platynereis dumerilii]
MYSPVHRARSVTPMSSDIKNLIPTIADHNVSNHMSHSQSFSGGFNPKNYYNSASGRMYSRYSPGDWENSNKSNFNLSERERSFAERLRGDVWRAVKSTDTRTRNRQSSNTKRLGNRVYDITFWKGELTTECRLMDTEIDNLKEHKRVLEKALSDTKGPLQTAEECLLQREKRQGIDNVVDDVEKHLSKEVDIIKRCQDKMKRLVEKSYIQLKMDRAAQHACDKDAKDKHHAQGLDDRMHQLRNSSNGLGFHPGIENVDNTLSIPESWIRFTQENIARSQKERELSERLRGEIDALLRACANEMWSNYNSVNNALNSRVQQTQDAKNKLQGHLARTANEIHDMEKAIGLLKKAIHDKELPMKLAQTRLEERTHRINVEICNDPVMKGLQKEVHEIRESVRYLKDKLRSAESALSRLMKTKATLEHDISVKENSLMIDSKYCLGMRKNMPMDPKIGPIFNMPSMAY